MNAPTTPTTPATRKGEETRERILAAARELIHQRGYKSTGLADILEASGVPKGSFYFYFRNKEELGQELLARYRRHLREEVAPAVFPQGGEVIPQILAFFHGSARAQTEGGCKSGCLLGNLAAEITDIHEDLRREIAASFLDLGDVFAGVLRRGQETGELSRDFDPGVAAQFLLSVLEGTTLVAKARREPATFEATGEMLARYLETLRKRPRPEGRVTIGGLA